MKKESYLVSKKYFTYEKKDLALMITIKNIINSGIIVIILENIEELHMTFAI